MDPLDPDDDAVDPASRALVADAVGDLERAGFARTTWYRSRSGSVTAVGALLEHPRRGDLASVVVMGAGTARPRRFVILETEWEDDYRVTTTDSAMASVFPRVPGLDAESLPSVQEPARLYRVHCARADRMRRDAPRRHLARGEDPIAAERARQVANLERFAPLGYQYREGDQLRPTFRGAFLMAWRLLPPLRQLQRRDRARRERALLRDLGVDGEG